MKLRSTHNSIRIRIRKSELAKLQQEYIVEECVKFPTGALFKFALTISTKESVLSAQLEQNTLILAIPEHEAMTWITTNAVGIESYIPLSGDEKLHLLIEKDFPCLDRVEEDKSDTFWELAPNEPDAC